jgi:hypothetical protein
MLVSLGRTAEKNREEKRGRGSSWYGDQLCPLAISDTSLALVPNVSALKA